MEYLQYIDKEKALQQNSTVLNLIINGIPSIPINQQFKLLTAAGGFKPYYKWNTFNTLWENMINKGAERGFKPYYKWNTFNTF